tara:strand:- start:239 stop:409 length:171 start_codon:yes stop_codon:yes gene_type:complete
LQLLEGDKFNKVEEYLSIYKEELVELYDIARHSSTRPLKEILKDWQEVRELRGVNE